jgi:hypothetical protein
MRHDWDRAIDVQITWRKLLAYCRANDWAGYDPYDALNSKLFEAFPALHFRIPQLALTQALKRSPINVRPLLRVPKTQSPKAIALALSALLRVPRAEADGTGGLVPQLAERLLALRSPNTPYCSWGCSFPWQTRTIVVPRWAPNVVCTTFGANALLDLYDQSPEPRWLECAVSAAQYMVNDLYWSDGASAAGFGYPLPSVQNQVHNANFLTAAFLCRVYRLTGDAMFREPALNAARYSASRQLENGSWHYGEGPAQNWVDNFHTGFNLCGLRAVGRYLESDEFEPFIRHGLAFYKTHFFRGDGAPRYFHDETYPIDIHCAAQAIITLLALKDVDADAASLAASVFQWAVRHMWDERGFFYYRALRFCTVKISYLRWSQAWMLVALAHLLADAAAHADPFDGRGRQNAAGVVLN